VFRLEGGQVRALTEYMDSALVNTTFGRPAAAGAGA